VTPMNQAMRTLRRHPLLLGLPVGLAVAQALFVVTINPYGPLSSLQLLAAVAVPFTTSGVNVLLRNGVRRGPVKMSVCMDNLGTYALPIAVALILYVGATGLLDIGPAGRLVVGVLHTSFPALAHLWLAALVMDRAKPARTLERCWGFLRGNVGRLAPLLLASLLVQPFVKSVLTPLHTGSAQGLLSAAVGAAVTIGLRAAVFHVADS
jgi:hypothetical protein